MCEVQNDLHWREVRRGVVQSCADLSESDPTPSDWPCENQPDLTRLCCHPDPSEPRHPRHPSRDIRGIRAEPILNPFPLSAAQPSPATAKVSSNQQPADSQPAGGCCTLTDLCLFSLLSWTPSGTYDIRQQSTTAVAHAGRGAEEKGAGQRGRGTRKLSTKERT